MVKRTPRSALRPVFAGAALFLAVLSWTSRGQERPDGRTLFLQRCGGCHALDRDKEGPRLGGVYGRKAGSVDTFQYSDALKRANVVWNDEMLERWLAGTEKLVPGNDMTFHVESPAERRAIIGYLKRNSEK